MLLSLTKLDWLDEWCLCTPKDTQSSSQGSKRRYYLKFQDVDWKIVITLILKKYTVRMRLKFIRLGIGASNVFCKRRVTSRLSQLTVRYFLNKDFVYCLVCLVIGITIWFISFLYADLLTPFHNFHQNVTKMHTVCLVFFRIQHEPLCFTNVTQLTLTWSRFRLFFLMTTVSLGARGRAVGWGTALQARRSRVRFPMVSLEFFIDINLSVALWPWDWLKL